MTEVKTKARPSLAQQEMDKLEDQFNVFDQNVKDMTLDRMNQAPKHEVEAQTKMSQKDLEKSKQIYLKPERSIGVSQKFNERFRKEYEEAIEYVNFTAENLEAIGETIDIWSRPFGGMPAEWWKVPTNVPVWGPRHLAEQIKRKFYHRLVMKKNETGSDGMGQYYGTMAADTTIQRLDAKPVSNRKSIFMGANSF